MIVLELVLGALIAGLGLSWAFEVVFFYGIFYSIVDITLSNYLLYGRLISNGMFIPTVN